MLDQDKARSGDHLVGVTHYYTSCLFLIAIAALYTPSVPGPKGKTGRIRWLYIVVSVELFSMHSSRLSLPNLQNTFSEGFRISPDPDGTGEYMHDLNEDLKVIVLTNRNSALLCRPISPRIAHTCYINRPQCMAIENIGPSFQRSGLLDKGACGDERPSPVGTTRPSRHFSQYKLGYPLSVNILVNVPRLCPTIVGSICTSYAGLYTISYNP